MSGNTATPTSEPVRSSDVNSNNDVQITSRLLYLCDVQYVKQNLGNYLKIQPVSASVRAAIFIQERETLLVVFVTNKSAQYFTSYQLPTNYRNASR